jgi:hypothetical protein
MRPASLVIGSLRLRRALRGEAGTASVATRLLHGWGNPRYAASPELLTAVIQAVAVARGPIVECGSGVTSIVLATAARQNGTEVLTLEHDRAWAERVRRRLRRLGLSDRSVAHRPLVSRGDHDWYDVGPRDLPSSVALLLCDGPPASTRGGRIGVLDVVDRLRPSVIIVDDTDRYAERTLYTQVEALGYERDEASGPGSGTFTVLRATASNPRGSPA